MLFLFAKNVTIVFGKYLKWRKKGEKEHNQGRKVPEVVEKREERAQSR